MTKEPIRVWFEPIDSGHTAIISSCRVVHYGVLYGVCFFVIADGVPGNWSSRRLYEEIGEKHFRQQLIEHHHGHLPPLGRASELRE